jgi:pyridoxal phosphate enzyme (YggS family)
VTDARRDELAANLREVVARIDAAATAVGRDPSELTLVVVTKTWPASDVRLLASLGVREVGENRDQEAAPKAAELADLPLVWHFVGQLQTNKVRSVARYADVVESVDRPRLVDALDRAAQQAGRRVRCLVQVALDDEPARGGVPPAQLASLADQVAAATSLDLGGVMAVAPLGTDPEAAFARLAALAQRLRVDHPEARTVSAGMSHDLEAAVRHGATHVRIGTAVLGHRPPIR